MICEECGFAWDHVDHPDVEPRVRAGVEQIVAAFERSSAAPTLRPSSGTWSMLEYAAHVRDVLLALRERTVAGLVEDLPGFTSLHRDERVLLGLYRLDTVEAVVAELRASAAMYGRLFAAVDRQHLGRCVQYGSVSPVPRSLLWLGQNAVHEVEHHSADIQAIADRPIDVDEQTNRR